MIVFGRQLIDGHRPLQDDGYRPTLQTLNPKSTVIDRRYRSKAMKIRHSLIFSFVFPFVASAAEPGPASLKPEDAAKKLIEVKQETSALRFDAYKAINKLNDEALSLGKELRKLDREHDRMVASERRLQRAVEGGKTNYEYSSGILNQYGKALLTRLHPAENQKYGAAIESLEQQAATITDDPGAEVDKRLDVLALGIDRLGEIAGGMTFDGKALKGGSESISGTFLNLGPFVYFAAENATFEGVATYNDSGTELPTVVAIQQPAGAIRNTVMEGKGTLPLDGSMGKALEVEAAKDSLVDTAKKGGYVGYAILGLGAVSILIAIFKVIQILGFPVPSRRKINLILDDILVGKHDDAMAKARKMPGLTGEMVVTGVERFHDKRRVLEEALFEKMVAIKPKLESALPFLGLVAAAAPLMGLLGTVLGIIKTFQAMAIYGTGNAKSFSAGISEALITTAEGLVVAIPVLVIHGILKSFVKAKFGEIEGIAIAIINGTSDKGEVATYDSPESEDDDDMNLEPVQA